MGIYLHRPSAAHRLRVTEAWPHVKELGLYPIGERPCSSQLGRGVFPNLLHPPLCEPG